MFIFGTKLVNSTTACCLSYVFDAKPCIHVIFLSRGKMLLKKITLKN